MWGVRSNSGIGVLALLACVVSSCADEAATDGTSDASAYGAGGIVSPSTGGIGGSSGGIGRGGTSGATAGSGGAYSSGSAPSSLGGSAGGSGATGGATNGGASDADAAAGGANDGGAAGGASNTGGAGDGGAMTGGTGNGGGAATGGANSTGGIANTGGAPTGGVANTGGAPTGGVANTGGAPTGGVANTGGAPTGGVANTGGAPTGGVANTGGAPTGGVANTGGAPTGGTSNTGGAGGSTSCLSTPLMTKLGKSSVLVGASMSDATATAAPFDMRYLYLAGGLFDGTSPCNSCATGCTSNGVSCANSGPGCGWWGCWQYDQDPPGAYARGFFATALKNNQFPMITYYMMYAAAGYSEGAELTAVNDVTIMQRYIADWRFIIDQVAGRRVFLHIEPDFWGFAEQANQNPHSIPAAVASANSECAGFENSIAGLGRCMIDMVRRHAPTALVGLHGSGWATKIDVLQNRNASLDVAAEANKLGAFLSECGAGNADYVVVDASDRDAAYYEIVKSADRWWDDTNATLPNFHQAFTWSKALAERVGVPIVWWQVPVGNMSLNNTNQHYRDNRLDYFFGHMDEVAASHGVAVLFGAGDGSQTTPETDGGNLIARVKAYSSARTPACP